MSRDWIGKADNSGSLGPGDKITIGAKDYILGELLFFRGISTAMIRLNEKERSITLYSEKYGSFQMCNIGKDNDEFWEIINDTCKIP